MESLFAEGKQYDVIVVTESKLSDNIKTEDILLEGFEEPNRKDRTEDQGGGIIVYIKKNHHTQTWKHWASEPGKHSVGYNTPPSYIYPWYHIQTTKDPSI